MIQSLNDWKTGINTRDYSCTDTSVMLLTDVK